MKPVFLALFLVCFPPLGNVKKLKRKYIERMRQKCPNSLKSAESSAAAVQKVRENKVNNRGNGAYKSGNLEPGDSKAGPPSPNITYEHFECFFCGSIAYSGSRFGQIMLKITYFYSGPC